MSTRSWVISIAIVASYVMPALAQDVQPVASAENTLDACRDGKDNDADTHIDCADQDCSIFAICVKGEEQVEEVSVETESSEKPSPQESGPQCSDGADNDQDGKVDCEDESCASQRWCRKEGESENEVGRRCADGVDNDGDSLVDCDEPSCKSSRYCETGEEIGLRCRDEKDNNENGLIDCQEESCHSSWYCTRKIYYIPETAGRPIGIMVSVGGGVALPNWRRPSAKVPKGETVYNSDSSVPFDPDVGGIFEVEVSYFPVGWIGGGLRGHVALTGATNRNGGWVEDPYKFDGVKVHPYAGAFARFQYPFKRIIPYLGIHAGYSYARYRWWVYSEKDGWNAINNEEEQYKKERHVEESHHFTLAVEPGFDLFVRKRDVAVGLRAWFPIIGAPNASMDNLGVSLNVTFTPGWREFPTLKPEYANPKVSDSPSVPTK